jgi:two-component system, OmpR family, response regulator
VEAVTASARLLVVDDEATILELLAGSLRLAGFEVVTAASGAEAVRAAASSRPDLVLLDVMMPDGDGFEALRRIRDGGSEVPVIFLTARDEVPDRVKGFDIGGDDYVTKPFSLDELLGRIRAVLKRSRPDAPGSRLRVADLEMDEEAHEVRRGGAVVALTPTEYRLLQFLMANAGRVVSKAQILGHVWGHDDPDRDDPDRDDPDRDGNVVEPAVSYLRRKVDQGQPRLIHTVRGFGYVLRIPPP